jgi:hypothetical protein
MLIRNGCVYYGDDQIRYTDPDHKSGQLKKGEWKHPGIEVPLN